MHIGFLCVFGLSGVSELPSSDCLQVLKLRDCVKLTILGDYKNLSKLTVFNCNNLRTVGMMEKLSILHCLANISTNTLQLFPLEQLISLNFYGSTADFLFSLPRLKTLKNLDFSSSTLHFLDANSLDLGKISLPRLESLSLNHFRSVDISGLISLTKLIVTDVSGNIEGKDKIYHRLLFLRISERILDLNDIPKLSVLRTLDVLSPANDAEKRLAYSTMKSLVNLKLPYDASDTSRPFVIQASLKSFEVSHNVTVAISHRKSFHKVHVSFYPGTDLTMFRNTDRISLHKCVWVTDISPLAHIPRLTIRDCKNIRDFSCLGRSQRYLEIDNSADVLTDAVVNQKFDKIPFLLLYECRQLKQLFFSSSSPQIRFLSLTSCENLSEVHLNGKDYVFVSLYNCQNLSTVNISRGRVYCLSVSSCKEFTDERITGLEKNCAHLMR
jgi:hypothetical protein